ncbi:hypothetical protein ACYVOT_003326 [Vibrio cholerae]
MNNQTLIDDHCTCGEAITIELNASYATRKDGKRPFYQDSDYPERSNQLRCRKCLEWIADTVPAAAYETTTKEQA